MVIASCVTLQSYRDLAIWRAIRRPINIKKAFHQQRKPLKRCKVQLQPNSIQSGRLTYFCYKICNEIIDLLILLRPVYKLPVHMFTAVSYRLRAYMTEVSSKAWWDRKNFVSVVLLSHFCRLLNHRLKEKLVSILLFIIRIASLNNGERSIYSTSESNVDGF